MKNFGFTAIATDKIDELETKACTRARVYERAEQILRIALNEADIDGLEIPYGHLHRGISESDAYNSIGYVEDQFRKLIEEGGSTPIALKTSIEGYVNGTVHPVKCIACGLFNGTVQDGTDPDLPIFEKYLRSFNNEALNELLKIEDRKVLGDAVRAFAYIALKGDYVNTINAIERINDINAGRIDPNDDDALI